MVNHIHKLWISNTSCTLEQCKRCHGDVSRTIVMSIYWLASFPGSIYLSIYLSIYHCKDVQIHTASQFIPLSDLDVMYLASYPWPPHTFCCLQYRYEKCESIKAGEIHQQTHTAESELHNIIVSDTSVWMWTQWCNLYFARIIVQHHVIW